MSFICHMFFIFESSQLNKFETDLQDSDLSNYLKILGTRLSFNERVHLGVSFNI